MPFQCTQVIETAVQNSKLHVVVDERKLWFNDFSQYNQLLKWEYAPLSPWNDFVQNAPQSIVFVSYMLPHKMNHQKLSVRRDQGTADCNAPSELALLKAKGFV